MRLHIDVHLQSRPAQNGKRYWRAYWTDQDGKPHYKGLGCVDDVTKRDAQRVCRHMEREFAAGLVASNRPSRVPTLAELIELGADRRKDNRPIRNCWNRTAALVREWNGTVEIDAVTRAMASGFREFLAGKGYSDQTIRHHIARIRAALNEQVRHETIRANVFDHIPAGVVRRDKTWNYLAPEVVLSVTDHPLCHPDVRVSLLLARFAGLRANEIGRLLGADVDLERRTITIANPNAGGKRTTKKRVRVVPIQPALHSRLSVLLRDKPGPVIETDMDNVRNRFPACCAEVGLAPWPEPLQVLRRCCLSDWCSAGISAPDVAEIAGNSVQVIMDHYFKVRSETLARIAHTGMAGLRAEIIALVETLDENGLRKALESLQILSNPNSATTGREHENVNGDESGTYKPPR